MTRLQLDTLLALQSGFLENTPGNLEILLDMVTEERKRIARAAHLISSSTMVEEAINRCRQEGITDPEIIAGLELADKQKQERLVDERVNGAPEWGRKR